jgi:hypothetical protein
LLNIMSAKPVYFIIGLLSLITVGYSQKSRGFSARTDMNIVWMTIKTDSLDKVVKLLEAELKPDSVSISNDVMVLHQMWSSNLVIARMNEFVYVGGWGLPYGGNVEKGVTAMKNLVLRMAAYFPEVCAFADHQGGISYFWMRCINGEMNRAYCIRLDDFEEYPIMNVGKPSSIEYKIAPEYFMPPISKGKNSLDEEAVRMIAKDWSFDPYNVASLFKSGYLFKFD